MKQQIIVSGTGGQGVLFLTRVLAEAALEMGLDVVTSETHGMAMRGGTVISHVKAGRFRSPIIRRGEADIGLFLRSENLEVHGHYLKPTGGMFINAATAGNGRRIDATELAKRGGSLVIANLVLLGFAAREGSLFCDAGVIEAVLRRISPPRQRDLNLKGLQWGLTTDHEGTVKI